jgi:protein-tyrosine phosphatase
MSEIHHDISVQPQRALDADPPVKVLFVCKGNICRSPTALGVLRSRIAEAGLEEYISCDSCGVDSEDVGEPPDTRAQNHSMKRGYDISAIRARNICQLDFETFDLILVMDEINLNAARALCPPHLQHRLRLFMSYAGDPETRNVPDPYYGGPEGFEHVLDMIEQASTRLLVKLKGTIGRPTATGK